MILKAVVIFLIAMLVLGMFGRWRRPRTSADRRGKTIEASRKCQVCGTYLIGSGPGSCMRPDCPNR